MTIQGSGRIKAARGAHKIDQTLSKKEYARRRARAQMAAYRVLKERYREEYDELYQQMREEEGLPRTRVVLGVDGQTTRRNRG